MSGIIQTEHLTKVYPNGVTALEDISLNVEQGDIFGIIGMSGAGKSTLVRLFNFLERPSGGTVKVKGKDLAALTEKELRQARSDISMIFQHFNLLMQRNVLDNICFPLEVVGVSRREARARAAELLEVVGLTEKAKAYPSQLSGGQKQRVAIARALATNPSILLCDEATSALDPQTTQSILELLQDINRQYGITIIVITHEMSVVQEICNKVAVLDGGRLAETGEVAQIFAAPQTDKAKELIFRGDARTPEMRGKRCIRIVFQENSAFEPVIGNMILQYKTPVNILFADTKNVGGIATGEMILQLPEKEDVADRMIEYLRQRRLVVEEVQGHVSV